MTIKIMVTNAEFKHTLAAVRSLGKKGMSLTAGSHLKHAIVFYSKYCKERMIYPTPQYTQSFIKALKDKLKHDRFDVLLPIGYNTTTRISKHLDKLTNYVKVPISDYNIMQIAADKNEVFKLAEKIGVPIPQTFYPKDFSEVKKISKIIRYPVVIKGSEENKNMIYANTKQGLLNHFDQFMKTSQRVRLNQKNQDTESGMMIQEYI